MNDSWKLIRDVIGFVILLVAAYILGRITP